MTAIDWDVNTKGIRIEKKFEEKQYNVSKFSDIFTYFCFLVHTHN